jgi:hypothetical protein
MRFSVSSLPALSPAQEYSLDLIGPSPRAKYFSTIPYPEVDGFWKIGDNLEARFPRDGFQFGNKTRRDGRLDDMRRHRFVTSWVYDVPGPQSGAVSAVLGGWQATGIYQWESGEPFTIMAGTDTSRDGIGGDRAIRTGQPFDPQAGSNDTVWFNAAAFARGPAGSFGEIGEGELFGPSTSVLDLGLFKRFRITGDVNVQFRAEFLNFFNTVNLNNPRTSVGQGGFGTITSADDPRIMQFGLKFVF